MMTTQQFEVGDSIMIEVTIYKKEPFVEQPNLYDPEQTVVRVKDRQGNVVWSSQLERVDTGKWYTVWNTVAHKPGDYVIEILVWNGSLNDPLVMERSVSVVRLV